MATFVIGNGVHLRCNVRDKDGVLSDATVTATVRKPDGSTITPSMSSVSTGVYESVLVPCDAAGEWRYRLAASGAVTGAVEGRFKVNDSIV